MSANASVEAAPIAGANLVTTPSVDSQATVSPDQQGTANRIAGDLSSKLEDRLRAALAGQPAPTEETPTTPTVVAEPWQIAEKPVVETTTTEPVVAAEGDGDDAEVTPEGYGPDVIKTELKRINPEVRKVLHNAFYRSEAIKETGFKVEDLRLMKNAGFTPDRMLTTLQRFPVPEAEVDALRDANSWQQFHDDVSTNPRNAIMGLAQSLDPGAFRQFVAETARAIEVIDPQGVSRKEQALAQKWVSVMKDRGKRVGGDAGENMIAAADIFAQDMGIDGTATAPEIPEEYRRRMSQLEQQNQENQQRAQTDAQRQRANFGEAVYGTVKAGIEAEAMKMLSDTLSPEQKTWVLTNTLADVERSISGNNNLIRTLNRMIDSGNGDQAHFDFVVQQAFEPGRRLLQASIRANLNKLAKLSPQASATVRQSAPAQTVAARTASPAQPRREPAAQGTTPPPASSGKVEIKGRGAEAAQGFFAEGLRRAGLR